MRINEHYDQNQQQITKVNEATTSTNKTHMQQSQGQAKETKTTETAEMQVAVLRKTEASNYENGFLWERKREWGLQVLLSYYRIHLKFND